MPRTWNIVETEDNVSIPTKQVSMMKHPLPNQATQALYTLQCLSFSFCRMALFPNTSKN